MSRIDLCAKMKPLLLQLELPSPIVYQSPKNHEERAISTLSKYFYLGGKKIEIIDRKTDTIQFQEKTETLPHYEIAAKITSYILLFPITCTLFGAYLILLDRHKITPTPPEADRGAAAAATRRFENKFPPPPPTDESHPSFPPLSVDETLATEESRQAPQPDTFPPSTDLPRPPPESRRTRQVRNLTLSDDESTPPLRKEIRRSGSTSEDDRPHPRQGGLDAETAVLGWVTTNPWGGSENGSQGELNNAPMKPRSQGEYSPPSSLLVLPPLEQPQPAPTQEDLQHGLTVETVRGTTELAKVFPVPPNAVPSVDQDDNRLYD